ncbi:MAG: type II toxin-antitoxin system RelE/ParE family toxin [Bacilli bacterium]
MKQIFHDDFLGEDIPRILEEIGDSTFKEFSKCLDKTFAEIESNPPNGAPLERSLALYRKKKFHSVLSPSRGMRADYRLVYRCDFEIDELVVLGVGRRNPGQLNDIYTILNTRSPI